MQLVPITSAECLLVATELKESDDEYSQSTWIYDKPMRRSRYNLEVVKFVKFLQRLKQLELAGSGNAPSGTV